MCMAYRGNEVLVIDRKKQDQPETTFSGGQVETSESFTDSAIREVKEETGLTIFSPQLCSIKDQYEDGKRRCLFLQNESIRREPISSDKGEVRWEDLVNLPNLNLSLDMEEMLQKIILVHFLL